MAKRTEREATLGERAVATRLGLTRVQAQVAIRAGLLAAGSDGKALETAVDDAQADRKSFLRDVADAMPVTLVRAAALLGTSPPLARQAIAAAGIPEVDGPLTPGGHWRTGDIRGPVAAALRTARSGRSGNRHGKPKDRKTTPAGRPSGKTKPGSLAKRPAGTSAGELDRVSESQQLFVRVVSGIPGPKSLTIHAGPTNSGKTHDALAALAAAGRGVYAGPLRMLAREAHAKLSLMLGPENVGLQTGEEQENTGAPVICATTESAPARHGGVLILDECHWLSDPQRGWAWTRMLVSSRFEHIHAITDEAAARMVESLVPDAGSVSIVRHPRMSTLEYAGEASLEDLPVGAAVVVFSRAAVLAVAGMLRAAGRRPAVLYGALPPAARDAQVALLASGEADIVVTTDVIGHGINLPLTAVALGETVKFDGVSRRTLHLWEAAQILGRAGRFGHGTEIGETYAVTGVPWFTSVPAFIREATDAAAGRIGTRWPAPARAFIRPVLGELHAGAPGDLPSAVAAFALTTRRAARLLPIQQFDAGDVQLRLSGILELQGSGGLPVDAVWGLVTCPVNDPDLIVDAAGALLGRRRAIDRLAVHAGVAVLPPGRVPLAVAERAAGVARDLRALTVSIGDLPGVSAADAAGWEARAGKAVVAALASGDSSGGFGACSSCGAVCPPWFPQCDSCHRRR